MPTMYRGYDIKPHAKGGFTWTDERNFEHFHEGVTEQTYASEDGAMNDIDAYKRRMRQASVEA